MKLTPRELGRLLDHYSGNCFSCPRCDLYERIARDEPGAVAAYVRYMREHHNQKIKTIPG